NRAMTDPNEFRRNQALTEARAKIFWGDPPVEGIKRLMLEGISYEEASSLVAPMVQERNATLRGIGLRKTLIGSGLVCVPILAWFIFTSQGYLPIKLFGVTVVLGLWGGWMLLNGIITLVAPRSES